MRLDLTLLGLVAPLAVFGDIRHSHRRTHSHHDIAKRSNSTVGLHKRFDNARWTFYDVGGAAGACGQFNTPDQHIVALNSAQYGGGYPGPQCWKKIVMQLGDKQTTATITDECPGCPEGGLDLTRGLFEFFDDLSVGVLYGEWWFADDGPDPSPSPKPSPSPSPKPEPKPTTTHKPDPPPTTTTHQQETTQTTKSSTTTSTLSSTHSSSHSSSAVSSSAASSVVSSSINYSSGVFSGLATPTGVASTDNGEAQNILACNQLLVNMGSLVVAAVDT